MGSNFCFSPKRPPPIHANNKNLNAVTFSQQGFYIPKPPRTHYTHSLHCVTRSLYRTTTTTPLSIRFSMENQGTRSKQSSSSGRRSLKRKLEEDFEDNRKVSSPSSHDDDAHQDLAPEVRTQVKILESTFSSTEADRASAKRAIHVLSELAKNGNSTSPGSEIFMYISV